MSMRRSLLWNCVTLAVLQIAITCAGAAQLPALSESNQSVVPQAMRYSGLAANRAGDTVEAVFRIYAAREGGEPLWNETQRVTIGADGKYSVLLGVALGRLPPDSRWASRARHRVRPAPPASS